MGPSNRVSCETGSFSSCHNPHRFLHSEVLRLQFHELEPWVVQSVLLPSCSSWLIHMRVWDILVHQLPPCLDNCPLHPCCPSPPFLPVWMNISSLILCCQTSIQFNFLVVLVIFFIFKLVIILPLVMRQSEAYLSMSLSWPEIPVATRIYNFLKLTR